MKKSQKQYKWSCNLIYKNSNKVENIFQWLLKLNLVKIGEKTGVIVEIFKLFASL